MKKLMKYFFVLAFFYTSSAYSLVDGVVGLGYSSNSYSTDSSNNSSDSNSSNYSEKDSVRRGYNLNAALFFPVIGVSPIASFILGPKLKYENVSETKTVGGIDSKFNFSTLQAGIETGFKFNFIPLLSVYGTAFFTYGVVDKFSVDMTSNSILIPNQTIEPSISNHFQQGLSGKVFYEFLPLVSLGCGLDVYTASYDVGAFKMTTLIGDVTSRAGSGSYVGMNANLLAKISL
jgi:hypothetical protein